MANSEHMQLLGQGERAWTAWREAHPDIRPDFTGADLRKRMLRSLDLSSADLSGADLRDTNFRRADLSAAKLDGARLHRAFLSRTKLDGASFKRAELYETIFADVDLSKVKSLGECVHKGPSVLDHRTLSRSRALPLSFLRGCGLPDAVIAGTLSPPQGFVPYWSCFISYSSRDQVFADQLHADLQAHGVRCWLGERDIHR
jgi:hypothetical protein